MSRGILGLGDKVESTQPQRLHGYARAFGAVRTEHDDRDRLPAHDLFQRVDSVHPRHFQVERDHVGLQFFNLLKTERAIHRRTHHFDGFILCQHLRDQLPHQG